MSTPILATKLYIPPTRAELVPRPRLLRQLNQGLDGKLTLLSAPAGFGKTTLLSHWIYDCQAQAHARHFVWLSLDEADNDLPRFLTYLVATLRQIAPTIGQSIENTLQSPHLPALESLMTGLLNDMVDLTEMSVIVLDDYHAIDNSTIDQALTFLLEYLPPTLHLVIASRIDPALPLSRLRARGQLTELRVQAMRFTSDEAATFLNRVTGLAFSAADIAALEARTEGWIAGLQLAALSMQHVGDVPNFIAAFTGSHRYIIDYLADEVLDQQPPALKTFLLQTAILSRLTAPLCDYVTQRSDSQAILEQMESANLFLVPLDNRRAWYRYHHLFGDLLRQRLRQEQPQQVSEFERRASIWYEQQIQSSLEVDEVTEAIRHALAAADLPRAVSLVANHCGDNLMFGNIAIVKRWLDMLPNEAVERTTPLSMFRGWVYYFREQYQELPRILELAEQSMDDYAWSNTLTRHNVFGLLIVLKSWLRRNQGRLDEAIDLVETTLAGLPDWAYLARGLLVMSRGVFVRDRGDFEQAVSSYEAAIRLNQIEVNVLAVMASVHFLFRIRLAQGRLREGVAMLRQVEQWVADQNLWQFPGMADYYLAHGYWLYEQNRLAEAEAEIQKGINIAQLGLMGSPVPVVCQISLAQVRLAQGELAAAYQLLRQVEQTASLYGQSRDAVEWLAMRVRLWVRLMRLAGDTELAAEVVTTGQPIVQHWLETVAPTQAAGGEVSSADLYEWLTVAQVYLMQGQVDAATTLLQALRPVAEAAALRGRLWEIVLLQIEIAYHSGNLDQARQDLAAVLSEAEAAGYVRLLVDTGTTTQRLLSCQPHDTPYINRLLAALGEPPISPRLPTISPTTNRQTLVEPLSERELEVLQLVAMGLSNREIAERLVLAVSTVKRHMSNIYGKLGVNSRTQAVAQARTLGVMS